MGKCMVVQRETPGMGNLTEGQVSRDWSPLVGAGDSGVVQKETL